MPLRLFRRKAGSSELEPAPVTPAKPTPTEREVARGPVPATVGSGSEPVEFSEETRKGPPAPRAATARRTVLPAQVGAARALQAMRRSNSLNPRPRRSSRRKAAARKTSASRRPAAKAKPVGKGRRTARKVR